MKSLLCIPQFLFLCAVHALPQYAPGGGGGGGAPPPYVPLGGGSGGPPAGPGGPAQPPPPPPASSSSSSSSSGGLGVQVTCNSQQVSPGNYNFVCQPSNPDALKFRTTHILWLQGPQGNSQTINIDVPNYKVEELIQAGYKKGQGSSNTQINVKLKKPEQSYDAQVDQQQGIQFNPSVNLQYEPVQETKVHYPVDKAYSPLAGPLQEPGAGSGSSGPTSSSASSSAGGPAVPPAPPAGPPSGGPGPSASAGPGGPGPASGSPGPAAAAPGGYARPQRGIVSYEYPKFTKVIYHSH